MRQPPESADVRRRDLGRQLEVGKELAFKIWRLSPILRSVVLVAGAALLVGAGWVISDRWDQTIRLDGMVLAYKTVFVTLALMIAAAIVPVLKWLQPTTATRGYLRKAALASVGFSASNIHLWTFDRLFLQRGHLKRLLRNEKESSSKAHPTPAPPGTPPQPPLPPPVFPPEPWAVARLFLQRGRLKRLERKGSLFSPAT